MWIKITCSKCNSTFSVKEEFIWKKWKCPKCGNIIEINKSVEVENIESNKIIKNNNNNKIVKKKKESRLWFALLLWLAIWAFFISGLSTWFFILAWWAIFLFAYDLYKKKK